MTRTVHLAAALLLALTLPTLAQSRPPITGISHMSVYTSDPAAADHFYTRILGAAKAPDPQNPTGTRFYFSPTQFIEVLPLPADHTLSRIAATAYNTPHAAALRTYLLAHNTPNVGELQHGTDNSRWFDTRDPEGNTVEFFQPGRSFTMPADAHPIGTRIIHVGYEVRSRVAEDTFFKALLGFQPYWFGAMQPTKLDWVSQQVPDGHDWLEYMLVGDGSDTPLEKVTFNQLGVLNHFSIGVPDMETAVTTLWQGDRFPPRHDGPSMGKDGKWQANLYDPDGTRVELMEFAPVAKPCCSDFTAASPTPPAPK